MSKSRYLSAKEAAEKLNVNMQTLYAYVSRGTIRSEAVAGSKRRKRYYAEDVEKLIARREGRRNPEQLAQEALHWGSPVMESAITLIDNGKLYYRGYDAFALAKSSSAEAVATLLWTGTTEGVVSLFDADVYPSAKKYATMLLHVTMDGTALSPIQAFQTFLPIAAADDPTAYDLRQDKVTMTGARLLRLMASVAAGDVSDQLSIAEMLQRGWCSKDESSIALFNASLIVCADHELNSSSFASRVVASTRSTPYACVMAGLAALQGARHGGHTERVEAFLREIDEANHAKTVIEGRLRRDEPIAGFGHKLYPDGDPRGKFLLDWVTEHAPNSPAIELGVAVQEAMLNSTGEHPNLDFGLVILSRALKLPSGSALAMFALGRTMGWIGHAIEQYLADWLIRPRATYIGQQPSS